MKNKKKQKARRFYCDACFDSHAIKVKATHKAIDCSNEWHRICDSHAEFWNVGADKEYNVIKLGESQ